MNLVLKHVQEVRSEDQVILQSEPHESNSHIRTIYSYELSSLHGAIFKLWSEEKEITIEYPVLLTDVVMGVLMRLICTHADSGLKIETIIEEDDCGGMSYLTSLGNQLRIYHYPHDTRNGVPVGLICLDRS